MTETLHDCSQLESTQTRSNMYTRLDKHTGYVTNGYMFQIISGSLGSH